MFIQYLGTKVGWKIEVTRQCNDYQIQHDKSFIFLSYIKWLSLLTYFIFLNQSDMKPIIVEWNHIQIIWAHADRQTINFFSSYECLFDDWKLIRGTFINVSMHLMHG